MSRKFKHKQTSIEGTVKEGFLYFERCAGNVCACESLSMYFVEGNLDWEEIVEKDYEILSLSYFSEYTNFTIYDKIETLGDDVIYRERAKNQFVRLSGVDSNESFAVNIKIHSVKRLSDGVVFTVGDMINGYTYSNREILDFIKDDVKGLMIKQSNGCTELVDASHCKIRKPIFTTKDGVEIFEDDYYWIVEEDLSFYRCGTPAHSSSGIYSERIYLSSSDACHEYILMNKPSLSLNDLLDVWGGDSDDKDFYKSSILFKSFERIVKKRL